MTDNLELVLLNKDNPWLTNAWEYVETIWKNQGKTNQRNCSGMSSFSLIGFTSFPLLYDATDDSMWRYKL